MSKLGQILVEKQLISRSQLEDAMTIQILGRKKLGELLVLKGLIHPQELQIALQEQVAQQIQEAVSLNDGQSILTWRREQNTYQATYSDELSQLTFVIQPKIRNSAQKETDYQVCYQYQSSNGVMISEYCGTRRSFKAAKQIAEATLKQLL